MTATARLGNAEATAFAHAFVENVARTAGIRVLAIKGVVSNHYRLREPRVSADADVLVEPSRFNELCDLLEGVGWRQRVGRETPSVLPHHSRTLIRDGWPCDLDVHWMFPGFFADAETVFDALWRGRSVLSVSHFEANIPSKAGAAVVSALHAQRNHRAERNVRELAMLGSAMSEQFTASEKEEFYRIARDGRCGWVLRELIDELELGEVLRDATPQQQRMWELNRESIEDGSAVSWWMQLRTTPWYAKPVILVRALWVPRAEVPRNDPAAVPTIAEAWAYQRSRWGRGVRALVRHLVRDRSRA